MTAIDLTGARRARSRSLQGFCQMSHQRYKKSILIRKCKRKLVRK